MSEVNCLITKVLIPFLEREVGPEASAAICRAAGRSREYLMADHNWIPLVLADELTRLGQELTGDPDTERWTLRLSEFAMDWKPREERSYLGTYSMGIGEPRGVYAKFDVFYRRYLRFARPTIEELGRRHARMRFTPLPAIGCPAGPAAGRWSTWHASLRTGGCRGRGSWSSSARPRVPTPAYSTSHWKNPSLGRAFWGATAAGAVCSALLSLALMMGPAARHDGAGPSSPLFRCSWG